MRFGSADEHPIWEDHRARRGMDRQLRHLKRALHAGGVQAGWKLGLGTDAAMARYGISGPAVGHLLRDAVVLSGESDIGDWAGPMLEPEIAVHIRGEITRTDEVGCVRDAIRGIGLAIARGRRFPAG